MGETAEEEILDLGVVPKASPAHELPKDQTLDLATAPESSSHDAQFGQRLGTAICSELTLKMSAAALLKRASVGMSFNYMELWLPAHDKRQLLFDADACALNDQANHTAMSVFRDSSKTYTFAKGSGLPGRVWETMQPEIRTNVQMLSESVFHRKSQSVATGLQGVMAWPVVSVTGRSVLGVLCAFFDRPLGTDQNREIGDLRQIQWLAQCIAEAMR